MRLQQLVLRPLDISQILEGIGITLILPQQEDVSLLPHLTKNASGVSDCLCGVLKPTKITPSLSLFFVVMLSLRYRIFVRGNLGRRMAQQVEAFEL